MKDPHARQRIGLHPWVEAGSYIPPELLRGQRGDQRADIWALGILLYEMVSGRRPFTGATGFELSAAVLHQQPAALPPAVPAPMRC